MLVIPCFNIALPILEQNFKEFSKCLVCSESLLNRIIDSHAELASKVSGSSDFDNELRASCKFSIQNI